MERRKFMKTCCYSAIGLPTLAITLSSCGSIYYATSTLEENKLVVSKSEFWKLIKDKKVKRPFVFVKPEGFEFPICIYETESEHYIASLLKCTHRGCELNVGGGIYSCPCHGSEFSTTGIVLEGPADQNLKTYKIDTRDENIYLSLS